jgi:hypothetical protein
MNNRRAFAGKLLGGLAGSFFAGTAFAKNDNKKIEDISSLKPENPTTLVLMGNAKKQSVDGNNLQYVYSNESYQNRVELSVGKDNRLWIKVSDRWCRVSID